MMMIASVVCLIIWLTLFIYLFFFFSSRRRHTRLVSDWSSDVCSSDLGECTDIGGATERSYTAGPDAVGAELRVRVTATNRGGTATATSERTEAVQPAPPVNTAPPSIDGTPRDGASLTADPGGWAGTPDITFAYQWQRCAADGTQCEPIDGATGSTYTATAADVGHAVAVAVTARNGGTLTADPGTWTGTPDIDLAYQWVRCDGEWRTCTPIEGATGSTFRLDGALVGQTVRVDVTARNTAGSLTASSTTTEAVTPVAPRNTERPAVTGTARAGETLTADTGEWTGTPEVTFGYQWERCDARGENCGPIAGATDGTYVTTATDVDDRVRVVVTARNAAGEETAISAPTLRVEAVPPSNTERPTVTGAPLHGSTLTADPGAWAGTPPIDITYRWERCRNDGESCVPIEGATDATYDTTDADVGRALRVVVRAVNPGGEATATSALTPVIEPGAPVLERAPSIDDDTPQYNQTLRVDPGTWGGTEPFDFAYQWQRCNGDGGACVDIEGSIGAQYTTIAEDVGQTLRVVVTASNGAGEAGGMSEPTRPVEAVAPQNTRPPSIVGEASVGSTLTADLGKGTGTPEIRFAYQWERCVQDTADCDAIAGATAQSYTVTRADEGFELRVLVTASNGAGSAPAEPAPEGTPPVEPPQPIAPDNTTRPSITGTAQVGATLTAD